jgi:hypothetical protein
LTVSDGPFRTTQLLAEFFSLELENTRLRAMTELVIKQKSVRISPGRIADETASAGLRKRPQPSPRRNRRRFLEVSLTFVGHC